MYDFNQHKHFYSVWTAARAVQRGWRGAKNKIIMKAIEDCDLRKYAENGSNDAQEFEKFHKSCCKKLMRSLEGCSYGRAAKIIAIYLKTSVILPSGGKGKRSKVIHPPIDSILWRNIAKKVKEVKNLGKVRWTKLEKEEDYWELVAELKKHVKHFDWHIEEFWNPVHE